MPLLTSSLGSNRRFQRELVHFLSLPERAIEAFAALDRSELGAVPRETWSELSDDVAVPASEIRGAAGVASYLFYRTLAGNLSEDEIRGELVELARKFEIADFDERIPSLLRFLSPSEDDEERMLIRASKASIGGGFSDVHVVWNLRPAVTGSGRIIGQFPMAQMVVHYHSANGDAETLALEIDESDLHALRDAVDRALGELVAIQRAYDQVEWLP